MQLENTLVKVRSRSLFELIDLTTLVLRHDFRRLLMWSFFGWVPLIVIDVIALYPHASATAVIGEYGFLTQGELTARLVYHLIYLVVMQAPMASMPLCYYIGQRMFRASPTWQEVWRRSMAFFWRKAFSHGVIRLALLAPLLTFWAGSSESMMGGVEFLLMPFTLLYASFIRCARPFLTEILSLEYGANTKKGDETYQAFRKRMRHLHGPLSGELTSRYFTVALLSLCLLLLIVGAIVWILQLVMQGSVWGWYITYIVLPISLFLVSTHANVFRFLNYIDARILLEGWEIRLKFMSEAAKLSQI